MAVRWEDLQPQTQLALHQVAGSAVRAVKKKSTRRTANSRFEELLAFQIRAHRLPEPHEQYRFAPPRQFKADFAWPEYRLLLEVQGGIWRPGGGAHSHPQNLERDVEKAQLAALGSWLVMPVTTDQVKKGLAIALLAVFFGNRRNSHGNR